MSERRVLQEGEPVFVEGDGDRIGSGPWARLLTSAIVPDESSARAQRGRELARRGAVSRVIVAPGSIAAHVQGSTGSDYVVRLDTATLTPSVWMEVVRASRGRPPLESGAAGTAQSVHLAHMLETQHHEPLVPHTRGIHRSCTCPDHQSVEACKHVAAVAFVVADAIDDDPGVLLHWRGCVPVDRPSPRDRDVWHAGPLPPARPPRALPPGAVVKRLGRSGIRVGGQDLADALAPAYRAFAALEPGKAR
jgi:hypothetical protein